MERVAAELVRNARDRIDFVVLSSDLPSDLVGEVEWERIALPRWPAAFRFLTFFVRAGWRLRRVDASLRHSTGAIVPNRVTLATVHFCHAAFRARASRRTEASASPARRLNTWVHRFIAEAAERRAYRSTRVECLAAVSSGLAVEIREQFPDVRVVVTPNGVDLERFHPDENARRSVRAAEHAAEDDVVALFVGGDWAHKGLDLAIEAVARVGGPLKLWVVGAGDERRYRRLVGGADVRFFGRRLDTERMYAAADIFVLPSSYETFSLAAHEAAASGLPVVTTDVSGVDELVAAGGGILIERTTESLAAALEQLAQSSADRSALGAAARKWVQQFTWARAADATVAVYKEIMQ